jgi:hypothetical protein
MMSIKAVTDIPESLRWSAKLLNRGGMVMTYKPRGGDEESVEGYGFELVNSLDVKELIDTIDVRIVMYKKS